MPEGGTNPQGLDGELGESTGWGEKCLHVCEEHPEASEDIHDELEMEDLLRGWGGGRMMIGTALLGSPWGPQIVCPGQEDGSSAAALCVVRQCQQPKFGLARCVVASWAGDALREESEQRSVEAMAQARESTRLGARCAVGEPIRLKAAVRHTPGHRNKRVHKHKCKPWASEGVSTCPYHNNLPADVLKLPLRLEHPSPKRTTLHLIGYAGHRHARL